MPNINTTINVTTALKNDFMRLVYQRRAAGASGSVNEIFAEAIEALRLQINAQAK